jgi:8-oxo-dGTP pyrophosphatase MutT (NUDIX family)
MMTKRNPTEITMLEVRDRLREYHPLERGQLPGRSAPLAVQEKTFSRGDHDLNPDFPSLGPDLTEAAIVIPLIDRPQGLMVLLTERSRQLKNHPGQVGFPGGRREPEDINARATALRELEEEISIPASSVSIINDLDTYITRTGFQVTPVVAELSNDIQPVPDPGEVEEIFEVPLSFLLDPKNRKVESREYEGKQRSFYAFRFEGHYIWGVSAGMIINLIEALTGPVSPPSPSLSPGKDSA